VVLVAEAEKDGRNQVGLPDFLCKLRVNVARRSITFAAVAGVWKSGKRLFRLFHATWRNPSNNDSEPEPRFEFAAIDGGLLFLAAGACRAGSPA
jgi:hypothetical protein